MKSSLTIGRGKRLFWDEPIPASFKLEENKASFNWVIVATYLRDGHITMGSS
jgi:hypothetical protein